MPVTGSTLLHSPEALQNELGSTSHPNVAELAGRFEANQRIAREALLLSQVHQKRSYNKGQLDQEFEVGDQVVLNAHSLELLHTETGWGKKLLMKYDGPFEIIDQVSLVAYRISQVVWNAPCDQYRTPGKVQWIPFRIWYQAQEGP